MSPRGEGTAIRFRLEMLERLDYVMSPLWRARRGLHNSIWGAMVAFERGYFEGVEFVEGLVDWDELDIP